MHYCNMCEVIVSTSADCPSKMVVSRKITRMIEFSRKKSKFCKTCICHLGSFSVLKDFFLLKIPVMLTNVFLT